VAGICAVAAGLIGWLVVPTTSRPAAAVTASAKSEESPGEQAKASGERVEILDKRTEDSRTFANPDGTFTLEQSAVPVRTRKNDQWVDLDATLTKSSDGLVRPKATSIGMAFSGGGDEPLVALESEGRRLDITWPTALPAPVVEEDSITYPSVYPGVDLKINVTTHSFSQVLVVHSREAAKAPELQKVEMGIEAPDLDVRRTAGGGIDVVDELGSTVFSAPKPTMWDSSGEGEAQGPSADRTEEPLEGDTVASMPVEVTNDSLAVTPDRALVDDPATVYPLHVDPPFEGGRIARSMINENFPTTPGWGWGGDEGVGYQAFEPWSRKRLMFGFTVAKIAGADVTSAVMSAFETWSASCTPKVVEAWKIGRFTEATTWSNGSGASMWQQRLAIATVAHGRDGCDPGGKWIPFNVKTAVESTVAARGSAVYLGLRAANETDELAWKRFQYNATLSVTYNYPPTAYNPRTEYPVTACVTTQANAPYISDPTPVPVISINDPDAGVEGEKAMAEFEVRRVVDEAPHWKYKSAWLPARPETAFKPPQASIEALSENMTYAWRARAFDGVSYSAWTTPCLFAIDRSRPVAPTISVDTPGPYTLNKALTVRFGPNGATDLAGYKFSVNDDVPRSGLISLTAPTATVTPPAFGTLKIYAWSIDKAGHPSAAATKQIEVDPTQPTARWLMNEGAGLSTADDTGNGHVMYFGPNVNWVPGNYDDDQAIELEGLQTTGDTTASAESNLVNTSQNFTVAARVKLGIKSNEQVIIGEDHPGRSSFTLGTSSMSWPGKDTADPADDVPDTRYVSWKFTVSTSAGPVSVVTEPVTHEADEWIMLAATFNRATRELMVYDNGSPKLPLTKEAVEIPPNSTVVDGTGPFRSGLGIDNSTTTHFFRGYLDDVHVYNGLVGSEVIGALRTKD
jgi:hypothetical protein